MTVAVPERVKLVMQMLTSAAANGRPCPSNSEIAFVIDSQTVSGGTNAIALLESMNLIKVYRGNMNRVVEIVSSGLRTTGVVRKPHWRARGARATITPQHPMKVDRRTRDHWSKADDALLMERIAEGDDFEQAGYAIGKTGDIAAARFEALAAELGSQAA